MFLFCGGLLCRSCKVWNFDSDVLGALNWATGETVAVKEIQLSNIPKGELPEIMVSGISTGGGTLNFDLMAFFISPRSICSRI